MNFDGFTSITFPRDEGIVYILCFTPPCSSEERPFYIGQSGRGTRRLNDYITAQFAAPTDFKIGVVVKELQEAGAVVTVKYKQCVDRVATENMLILEAAADYPLLNHEAGYNYQTDNKDEQLVRFKSIAHALLEGTYPRRSLPGDA